MSNTARDVIYRALRLIRVTASGETPAAQEATDALQTLNFFLGGLQTQGYHYAHTTLGLDDTINLQSMEGTLTQAQRDSLVGHLTWLLAFALCPEYGKEPTKSMLADATAGRRAFAAAFVPVSPTTATDGYEWMPSRPWDTGRRGAINNL
jgi:hypothetical protein